jgi:enoyl-CoA hydratase/carnithine racemase
MSLGGRCELALACHYRIILESANANANTKIQL